MTRNQLAAKVRKDKEAHPERYCPVHVCLWHTNDGRLCLKHMAKSLVEDSGYTPKEAREIVKAGGLE